MSTNRFKLRWILLLIVIGAMTYGGYRVWGLSSRQQAADPAPQKTAAVVHETPAPAPTIQPASGATAKIDLKATEPTWVGVYVDDKLTFAKVMEPAESKTIESSGKIRIRLGNAGGIEIIANGKPVGVVGRKGEARTVEFKTDGFRILPVDKPKTNTDVSG